MVFGLAHLAHNALADSALGLSRALSALFLKRAPQASPITALVLSLSIVAATIATASAQDADSDAKKHIDSMKKNGGGHMDKPEKCEFENPQDLANKVNEASLKDAQKRGINMDSRGGGPNGRNDALEGRFWASHGPLGNYKCTEFSAYLQCILQTLFDCTEEQVQSIADRTHMINRVKTNIFKNYNGPSLNGYVHIEPQSFFDGKAGTIGGRGLRGGVQEIYPKPQPYREGINRTNYDELQCKSGPGYKGDGSGASGGLFGGGQSSAMLSSMIGSMMGRMGQQPGGGGAGLPSTAPVSSGNQSPATLPAVIGTVSPTPTAKAVATGIAQAKKTPTAKALETAIPVETPNETAKKDGEPNEIKAEGDIFGAAPLDEFFDRKVTADDISAMQTSDGLAMGSSDAMSAQPAMVMALPEPTKSPYTF